MFYINEPKYLKLIFKVLSMNLSYKRLYKFYKSLTYLKYLSYLKHT